MPGFSAKTGRGRPFRTPEGFRRPEKPLQWAAMPPFGTSGLLHIGLVLGPRTLHHLGPVIRHLIVGLLDEPMDVSLLCPSRQCGSASSRRNWAESDATTSPVSGSLHDLHLPSPPVKIHG